MEHHRPNPRLLSDDSLDGAFPLPDWDFDEANEISQSQMLAKRIGDSTPHFAYIGTTTLATIACSYRERHIVLIGREPNCHDIAPLVKLLLDAGRQVQIETGGRHPVTADRAWVTLRSLPTGIIIPEAASRADEVLACIRSRADLERAEQMFGRRRIPVWLRPSQSAEPGMYRQCFAVATRHLGWRVVEAGR